MFCKMTVAADYHRQTLLANAARARLIANSPRTAGSHRVLSPVAIRSALASLVAAVVIVTMTVA
jgi:hypothetical protein